MDLANLKYKDDLPIRTINRIRNILGDLGILTIETVWRNSVEGFYSVSIAIEGTDLATNGKGASYQYALASAYGEMMERLQNQCVFRLSMDFKPETHQYQGFYYAPDEVTLSFDDVLNSSEDWLSRQFKRLSTAEEKRELLKLWQGMSYEEIPGDFIALPFLNLTNRRISHIPIKMLSKMYMSNGMCAGNTPEEALVQGISEVLERYVNKKVIRDRITPPTIPMAYLENYPRIYTMISEIKASGNFEVMLKDCSLGQGLPVVGVIFINRDDQTYFVKFGAHPIFEVAAERTLTELLQGQEIKRMMGVREFSYRAKVHDDPDNLMGILVNGSGIYPTEFFSNQANYPFQGFADVRGKTNKELLSGLLELLTSNGSGVFVRDASFLGFPSFQVVVPGFSEVEEFDDVKTIREYVEYNKIRKLIRNLGNLDTKGAFDIIQFIVNTPHSPGASVMDLLNLPVRNGSYPWYYSSVDLFLMALLYWQGDMVNTYESFSKYIAENELDARKLGTMTYYKCVRDYIGTRCEGRSEQEAIDTLESFYPADIVRAVIGEFCNPKDILSYQGMLNCWQCEQCPFAQNCLYQATERVYKILKDQYAKNPPIQTNLTELAV